MRRTLVLGLATLLLVACALRPTREQLAAADPGPYPDHYQDIVRDHFRLSLFDPFSAQYEFRSPEKGWASSSQQIIYGWHVTGLVNAKNRMGGYVGYKPFSVVIRNDRVIWSSMATR